MNRKKKYVPKVILVIFLVCCAIGIGCFAYIQDYYHADVAAIEAYFAEEETVSVESSEEGYMVFRPEDAKTGFIFYPGGKVEYSAYAPLMKALAEQGILCILVEMPGNLAVLDMNAADGLREQYPEIISWYMGGHSLGGSMAASYIAEHADYFDGLVLLGSYSTADVSDKGLEVLSVYGSEDMVMNQEKYEEYRGNLPENFTEIIIEGGCHAGFGMYGAQDGDGIPTITNVEQIEFTAEKMVEFIFKDSNQKYVG